MLELSIIQLFGFSSLLCLLFYIYYIFRPGYEPAEERSKLPLSEIEKKLVNEFSCESEYMYCLRKRSNHLARIHTKKWSILNIHPVAVVILVHGLNDHSGRLSHTIRKLLNLNYIVYTMDLEGFGRSGGRHGYIYDFQDLVQDNLLFINKIKVTWPNLKIFLIGGSLGALLIIHSVIKGAGKFVNGVIIQSPALSVHHSTRPLKIVQYLGNLLVYIVPKLPLVAANRGKGCAPEVQAQINLEKRMDPLFYSGRLRLSTGFAILKAIEFVEKNLHLINIPYLLQHGTSDYICSVDGSTNFYKMTTMAKDKKIILYKNASHDLSREPNGIAEKVFHDYIHWMKERI